MQVFLRVVCEAVRPAFAFLDTTFTANTNLGTTLTFHLLQAVTARANEQAEEVDLGELFDRDINLLLRTAGALLLVVFDGRAEVRVGLERLIDEADALILELLAVANLTSVGTATMRIIRWRW